MIIKALYDYYIQNKEKNKLPDIGFSEEKISFLIVIDKEGGGQLIDIRQESNGKLWPKLMIVPTLGKARSSNIEPNFLWDKSDYILGISDKADNEKVSGRHTAFVKLHTDLLQDCNSEVLKRVCKFLNSGAKQIADISEDVDALFSANIALAYYTDTELPALISDLDESKSIWINRLLANEASEGYCVSTGIKGSVAILHPKIKGIKGAASLGASFLSFNQDSFRHHNKEQGLNAPINIEVVHGYTAALNYLLRPANRRMTHIVNDTVVFWSDGSPIFDDFFHMMHASSDDESIASEIEQILNKVKVGELPAGVDPSTPFNILSIATDTSGYRVVIKFFYINSIGVISDNIKRHYDDMEIIGLERVSSLWKIIAAVLKPG